MSESVGRVLGTEDATPLSFWVGVGQEAYAQLDDVLTTERQVPGVGTVRISGVVTAVRSRHEGAQFDSDVFDIAGGLLPAQVQEAAEVTVTRVEPEVFVPPRPGAEVQRASGEDRDRALYFDGMARQVPLGFSRDGQPVYLNPDFLDGTRGRARLHLRHQRRRHEDLVRDLDALLAPALRRARRRSREHEGAHLQRQRRGPAAPRPRQHEDRRHHPRLLPPPRHGTRRVQVRGGPRAAARRRRQRHPRRGLPVHRRRRVLLDPRRVLPAQPPAVRVRRRRRRPPAVHDGRPPGRRPPAQRGPPQGQRRHQRRRAAPHQLPRPRRPHLRTPLRRRDPHRMGRLGHRPRHRQRVHPPPHRLRARHRPPHPRRPPPEGRRPHLRSTGHRRRPAQPARPGPALRRRRGPALRIRTQGEGRHGPATPVRRPRRTQQVRAARRHQPDQGHPARHRRTRTVPRGHPHRRPADRLRSRAQDRLELGHPGRRPPRRRRGDQTRIRVPHPGAAHAGPHGQARHHVRGPTRTPGPARGELPVPRLGHPTRRGRVRARHRAPGPRHLSPPPKSTRSTSPGTTKTTFLSRSKPCGFCTLPTGTSASP